MVCIGCVASSSSIFCCILFYVNCFFGLQRSGFAFAHYENSWVSTPYLSPFDRFNWRSVESHSTCPLLTDNECGNISGSVSALSRPDGTSNADNVSSAVENAIPQAEEALEAKSSRNCDAAELSKEERVSDAIPESVITPEQRPIAPFDEWTKEKLKMGEQKKNNQQNNRQYDNVNQVLNGDKASSKSSTAATDLVTGTSDVVNAAPTIHQEAAQRNYASRECGAKVLFSNEETENKVLHYAVAAFEGMKAYRGVDGKIRLFRPDLHMERMVRTAVRASLPKFEPQEMVKIISDLVALDKDWVPSAEDTSLYIRPTLIGNDHALHVGKASSAKLFVILSPVGKYYKTGLKPVTLLADPAHVRAFPGGVGEFKMACNYAPTIKISTDAAELGCQQVLWLFDKDEKVTEVGTMNFMTFWINEDGEKELITPPLTDGIILPGITRRSILELAREWGEFKVTEAYLTMAQIKKAVKERRVLEMFGTGTAAVVTPVGKIVYRDKALCNVQEIIIPTMQHKPNLTQRFYKTLTDIQYGRAHKQDWTHTVC